MGQLLGPESPVVPLARFDRHLALAALAIRGIAFAAGGLQGQLAVLEFPSAVSLGAATIAEASGGWRTA